MQGKTSEFQTVVSDIKPDIILGSESKLSPEISDAEVFPSGYVAFRRTGNVEVEGYSS